MVDVGFIGLGQMGAPMAAHLIPAGVLVHDVDPSATAALAEQGARVAGSIAELAASSTVISLMVRDDQQVHEVLAGTDRTGGIIGNAAPGTVIAVHSTISHRSAIEFGALAADAGFALVDAPVSGSVLGAHAGNLAVMVGGDDDAIARCREAFEPWSGLFISAGPLGSGIELKLARNLVHFASFAAVGEAVRLAEASGVSIRSLSKVMRHTDAITGGPSAVILRQTAAPMPPDDPWYATLANVLSLGHKDLSAAIERATELGIDIPLAALADHELARCLGLPEEP